MPVTALNLFRVFGFEPVDPLFVPDGGRALISLTKFVVSLLYVTVCLHVLVNLHVQSVCHDAYAQHTCI